MLQKLIVLFTLLAAVADCAVIGDKRKAYEDVTALVWGWVWLAEWVVLAVTDSVLVASVDMEGTECTAEVGMGYGVGPGLGLSHLVVLVTWKGLWWTGSL